MQCLFVWTRVRYWCVHIASHKHTVCQWVPDSLSGCVFQSAHGFLSCRVVICSSVWACCLADLATSAGKLIHCVTFTKQTNPKEGIFWRQSIPASFAQTGQQLEHILSIQLNVNCCSLWVSLRLIASISTRLYYEICGSRAAWILLIADPIVYDILEQIIKHTNYDGFGNIDYMYVDDAPKLFDFNPRPSGTLLRFGAPILAIWFKKYAGLFDSWHEVPQTQHIEKSTVVKGLRGFHLSYCRPFRTNYTTFYSQNQIKYLQCFYSVFVDRDVRVLSMNWIGFWNPWFEATYSYSF